MADQSDVTTTPSPTADPAAVGAPAGAGSGKNPLDILEEILNESKKAGGAGGAAAAQSGDASPEKAGETDPADADAALAAEEAAKLAQEREVRKQQEALEIQQRQQQLLSIKDSPEYQAAQDQKEEIVQQAEEYKQQMDGNQIIQIGHTKVQLDE